MKITKQGNFIRLQSDNISDVIDNIEDYSKVEVTANRNCCSSGYKSATLGASEKSWRSDLTEIVQLNYSVIELNIYGFSTQLTHDLVVTPVATDYVRDNCMSGVCTLQTYSAHFAPLFKAAIDDFFLTLGITSNVVISFSGNTLIIEGFPENYMPMDVVGGNGVTLSKEFTTDGRNKVFIGADSLFISASLFGETTLVDGVYEVGVKTTKISGDFIMESSCAFIDILTKCEVATHLREVSKKDSIDTLIHMMHYALINGSNCGCNCQELCKIYSELHKALYNKYIKIGDCGCQ